GRVEPGRADRLVARAALATGVPTVRRVPRRAGPGAPLPRGHVDVVPELPLRPPADVLPVAVDPRPGAPPPRLPQRGAGSALAVPAARRARRAPDLLRG